MNLLIVCKWKGLRQRDLFVAFEDIVVADLQAVNQRSLLIRETPKISGIHRNLPNRSRGFCQIKIFSDSL